MALVACGTKEVSAPVSVADVRYSQLMINARMSAWYNKDTQVGFPNVNSTNGHTEPIQYASWDYVPGVVAKGI
ncbi:MAG: hypothetical protein IKS76_05820, partial [Paludibacteraceae bacterium]|nr:hypothetical protein [Paludibacteraceae bacterium]